MRSRDDGQENNFSTITWPRRLIWALERWICTSCVSRLLLLPRRLCETWLARPISHQRGRRPVSFAAARHCNSWEFPACV